MAVSSTAIFVTWEEVPAINKNGIITMYEVQYVPLQIFGGLLVTKSVIISSPFMVVTITQLESLMEYNISVRAYTSVGPGPYSDGIINRTLEDTKKLFLCSCAVIYTQTICVPFSTLDD